MSTVALPVASARAQRWVDRAASALFLAALAVLLSLALGLAGGYRALVVHSDSMSPALAAGDVIVTRMVAPGAVATGDVVTFSDPSRSGKLVTHRVVRKQELGREVAFVTRGDANGGIERWKVDADGKVGRLVLGVPRVGYGVAPLAGHSVRLATLPLAALLLGVVLIRRIWAA